MTPTIFMILFINGSINSGKSTVAKLLQQRIPKTALVEVDSLRACIDWMPLEDSISLNLKNTLSLILNFTTQGLNVVIPYPLSEKNYSFFLENVNENDHSIFFITLAPPLDVILQNRGGRELTEWEKQRIQYHYQMGLHKPSFGLTLDNSRQKPSETVDAILRMIELT